MAIKLTEPQVDFLELERIPPISPIPDDPAPVFRDIELECGVKLRELRDLAPDLSALRGIAKNVTPDPLAGRFVLVDKKNDDRVVATFSLRKKLRPLCNGHCVLTNLNLDAKKLDVYGLTAALLFLRIRGPGSYGFFTALAPGHRTSDFESIREPLPIWNYVAQDRWLPLRDDRVQMGGLRGWFFRAPCFSSSNPRLLALLVWNYIEQGRLDQHDLVLGYYDGWFQCIPVERKSSKPISFSVLHPDEFGDFGGPELCGLVTSVKTRAMIEKLAAEPSAMRKHRLEAAYGEVCVITIGTTPFLTTQ